MNYFCKQLIFKGELNKDNALASKYNKITLEFAKFLNQMWNSPKKESAGWNSNSFRPTDLKYAIGVENSMFKGFQQHDSNELIQFLLD